MPYYLSQPSEEIQDLEDCTRNGDSNSDVCGDFPGIELQSRCIPLPPTSVSRFPGRGGTPGSGSQRTTREVYNRMYAQFVGGEYDENHPISREMVTECAEICRSFLYLEKGIELGMYTWKGLRASHSQAIFELRRILERTFKEFTLAKGYLSLIHI